MNPKYEQEIIEFENNFSRFKEKNIVLYGIGRCTATLLDGVKGFHIIGLMDKDPLSVGKKYFGVPVLNNDEVKEKADVIVINTAGTYWNLIYQRIKNIGIPIYYRNGEEAREEQVQLENNPYWHTSENDLNKRILEAEVISYDFYDTLFARRVWNPKDVIILLDNKVSNEFPNIRFRWSELRNKALQYISDNYCLDELYARMQEIGNLSSDIIKKIKTIEIELEKQMLIPRNVVLNSMKTAVMQGKEVYVITDMYLPKLFFISALQIQGIELKEENVLVSGIVRKNKADGSLWRYYKGLIGGRKALHIGDNLLADIEQPTNYDIKTYYLANVGKMLDMSSLREIERSMCSNDSSLQMGNVLSILFNNPFNLNATQGIPVIKKNIDMGYCVFGPVLLSFFKWLMERVEKDKIKRLVFMSRDGYFLRQDLEEFFSVSDKRVDTCYIGISRQLAMTAAANSEEEIWQLIDMPYTGEISEMLEDRFNLHETDIESYKDINRYLPQIRLHIKDIKERYKKYVDSFAFTNKDAVVDIGYYGNNQRYLNRIAETNMRGYYINANISEGNPNSRLQEMIPCFQNKLDSTGRDSGILKYQMYLESFLTAPYGMVKDIDMNGDFVCTEQMENQKHFHDKEEINEGVKKYIREYMTNCNDRDIKYDIQFVDSFYQICFSGKMEFSDNVKSSFYNDNAMMHRMESNMFC